MGAPSRTRLPVGRFGLRRPGRARLVRTATAVAAILFSLTVTATAAPTVQTPSADGVGKIEAQVLRQVAGGGQATVWAILAARADLRVAPDIRDWSARGAFVVERLKRVADASQKDLRSWLSARAVRYQSFWIANAVRMTAPAEVLRAVAARPEVARIEASRSYRIPLLSPGQAEQQAKTLEWGIERIRADQVWTTFGARGQGITVANVDTGVQYTHPALVGQYRGNRHGTFDHNYNWWDPSHACANPSPCDNVGHGTPSMGTMIGDDGAGNQIGVAPQARWIAAKGCESTLCSQFALLSSGQWILAPTDLAGNDPRPGLRPQIVNNSWDVAADDPFYRSVVRAWVASGIFPSFGAGASGPGCASVGAPAGYPASYGVGAFDINNAIASFSSRGPSPFGGVVKPDVAAPGVNIRSSWNDGGYAVLSGSSMAAPHLSGTVALMWSDVPSLKGRIAETIGFLDGTAVDMSGTCGGTEENNNTWGEGRLDAFAAVDAANGP